MSDRTVRLEWPAPAGVHAAVSTRRGGVSKPPWDSLNLGERCGDHPDHVHINRRRLRTGAGFPDEPLWLQQVHGSSVVRAPTAAASGAEPRADAVWSDQPGVVCGVLTADCLPILLCARSGALVAAIHAGWRGLAAGVIENCVTEMPAVGKELLAWLGPAIGSAAYEVGTDVHAALAAGDPQAQACFQATRPGHWLLDLYALARLRLKRLGVTQVFGGDLCTYTQEAMFFSYRRAGVCGRMFSAIWFI